MDRELVGFFGSRLALECTHAPNHSSKDTQICVWDRRTLQLHRILQGHDGPVNAVGLQSTGDPDCRASCSGRVVSASGDGKLMVWDIESGARLRVLVGHDRGLACIEFKVRGMKDSRIAVRRADGCFVYDRTT